MKKIILGIIFLASLSFQTGFAASPTYNAEYCDSLIKSGTQNDPRKIASISIEDIVGCGSPAAAKTEELSPLDIFQIIINAVAVLSFALGVLALVVSAIQIATSAGDKDKFKEALTLAKNAGLALILAMTAYGLLYLIINTFGFTL
jgi:methionine aminopeptidase